MAQQEAAPTAAARPPAANNVAPVSFRGLSPGRPVRLFSVIARDAPGRVMGGMLRSVVTTDSNFFCNRHSREREHANRRAVEADRMQHRDDPLLRTDSLAPGTGT